MQNQVAIITGGGTGIGRAAAIRLAQAGARVAIVGRRPGPLQETAKLDENIRPITADIASEADRQRVIETVAKRWDRIDVLVNNAASFVQRSLDAIDETLLTSLFATNVVAPSLLTQAALPFLKTARGSIINISSTFGHKAAADISHYAATKAALEHLTRCWALELARSGIRVNAIAPGPTETGILQDSGLTDAVIAQLKQDEANRIPLGRRGNPEDVAAWILHLADPSATWITGQVISIDGGLTAA